MAGMLPAEERAEESELRYLRRKLAVAEARNRAFEAKERRTQSDLLDYRLSSEKLEARFRELAAVLGEPEALGQRHKSLFDGSPVGYAELTPEGCLAAANATALSMFGQVGDAALGTPLLDYVRSADLASTSAFLIDALAGSVPSDIDVNLHGRSGVSRKVRLHVGEQSPRRGGQDRLLLVLTDGSPPQIPERALSDADDCPESLLHHDELTGLSNRRLFRDRLRRALMGAAQRDATGAVLFIDLDGFKFINDSLGHAVGDGVLCEIASRLRHYEGNGATVARLGGDEFAVILPGMADHDAVMEVAKRIETSLCAPIVLEPTRLRVTTRIGICLFPDDAAAAEEALRGAENTAYRPKSSGGERVVPFSLKYARADNRKTSIHRDLERAMADNELRVVYQPLLDARNGRIRCVEALARWDHPELGLLMPSEFIPVAEASGAIVELGGWMLDAACRQAAHWVKQGALTRLAVNVSPAQLECAGYVGRVHSALAKSDLAPEHLELELTETAFQHDLRVASQLLSELRESGVRLALDDFGTGHSSLTRLRALPISHLKLDAQFASGLETSAHDRALAKAVIAMAHELGLEVVCEGVETQGQMDFLMSNGCDLVHGFLVAKPLSGEKLSFMLAA